MRSVTLPAGRTTSALGFGCSQLATFSPVDPPEALLQAAFEGGITHFDVARSYGRGQCEAILGRFIPRRRDQVTVATKFGISAQSTLSAALAKAARLALKPFGGQIANRVAQRLQNRHAFSPADLAASIEASLRSLGTDHVDLLLMHECRPEDCTQALLDGLNGLVKQGKILAFGPATSLENTRKVLGSRPDFAQLAQFGNSLAHPAVDLFDMQNGRFTLTHSPLRGLADLQASGAGKEDQLSPLAGVGTRIDANLMLRYALSKNPNGIVLFSTRSKARLLENLAAASAPNMSPDQLTALERLFAR